MTTDQSTCPSLLDQLSVGKVFMGGSDVSVPLTLAATAKVTGETPFGGYKQRGYGRELGSEDLDADLQSQSAAPKLKRLLYKYSYENTCTI